MRVLYLTHSCPYPPNKGDRIRSFNILRSLSTRHSVRLVYPSFTAQDFNNRGQLRRYCESVSTLRVSPWLAAARCGLNLLTGRSFTAAYFYSRGLKHLIRHEDCDVVLVDCSSMAPYVMDLDKPKVLDFVDVDSDKWRLFAQWASFPKSLLYRIESERVRRLEEEVVRRFDACLVVSEREKALLPQAPHNVVVPNGVDLEVNRSHAALSTGTLIFSGAMNYFANVDAVVHFHKKVFPIIKKEAPGVELLIVGMQPAARVRRLQGHDTVVTGYVPDARSYFARASVCVAPLRIARGIQNKVLEAMAAGVPVVATSAANSGINAEHEKEILLADTPADFAGAVLSLLSDSSLRERIAAGARKLVEEKFRWDRNLERLEEVLHHATHRAR